MRIQVKEHGSRFYGPVKSSEVPTCLKYSKSWLDTRQSMEHLSGLSLNLGSEFIEVFVTHLQLKGGNFMRSFPWETYSFLFPVCRAGNTLIRVSALAFQHFWTPPEHESAEAGTNNGKEMERKAFILTPLDFSDTDLLKYIPWNMLWGLELITLICCQSGNKCGQLRIDPLKFLLVAMNTWFNLTSISSGDTYDWVHTVSNLELVRLHEHPMLLSAVLLSPAPVIHLCLSWHIDIVLLHLSLGAERHRPP